MSDGEQQFGLDIPDQSQSSHSQANKLRYLSEGNLFELSELLEQVKAGARQHHEAQPDAHTDARESAAILCQGIADGLKDGAQHLDADTGDLGRSLLLLGYLYGSLASPSEQELHDLVASLSQVKKNKSRGGRNGVKLDQKGIEKIKRELCARKKAEKKRRKKRSMNAWQKSCMFQNQPLNGQGIRYSAPSKQVLAETASS